jgi:GT2 family glycosyltransferase
MRVAVVILNWNGKAFLTKFLPSVIEHSNNATVYVADNASTDDSVAFVLENFPSVKLIETGENLGFAGGYNAALKDLNEDIFVLLNSDVEVTENWIEPIVELMSKDTSVAACQPKILQEGQKEYFEYAGAAGGYIDRFGFPFCRGRMFETLEQDNGQYNQSQELFWATGACMFVRSSVYKELGGLDFDFFAHMEEIDFCWRAKRAGFKIMAVPNSTVFHVGGGTLSKSNPRKTYLNFRNGLELLLKNLTKSQLLPIVLIRMILDGVAAFKFLVTGHPRDFWAVFKAHLSVYKRIRHTLNKRSGNYPPIAGIYQGSIVMEYFLKGKKLFSQLAPEKFSKR